MIKLNTTYSSLEIEELTRCLGKDFQILEKIENDCYVLTEGGRYSYNECFLHTDNEYLRKQKYEKIIPNRMFEVYNFIIMDSISEPGLWFRGKRHLNGNFEFECYTENLIDMIEVL